jgi:class 3 adenylate cyclase
MLATGKGVRSERKYVTILFADVTGFTPMTERLGPEEVVAIINRYYEVVTEVIFRYGGTIERYTGDGIMVLFGAPVTHENDSERAIRAALDLMQSVHNYNASSQFPLEIHVGIDSGWVVAGYIGSRWRMQYTAVGDTVNRSARIQGAAKSGYILVGESCYAQTKAHFEYVDEGTLTLKGKRHPTKVFRPLSVISSDSAHRRSSSQQRTFVGRDSELARLSELFTQVMQGRGQAIGISGDAGVGKSRLVSEFFRRSGAKTTFLSGQCLPYENVSAYYPLITIVRQYLAARGESGRDLRATFATDLHELGSFLSSFEDLLFMPPSQPDYLKLSAQARREMMFEALIALFRHLSRARPLILLIEDVQWIDHSSREFLTRLLNMLGGHKIFVVLTFRSDYQAPWNGHPDFTALCMAPLCENDGHALVETLFDAPVSHDLIQYILRRTEGNPFFAEELIRSLQESGFIRQNGHYSLDSSEAHTLPQTIHGVLASRIDRLDNETKTTLQVASIIGQEFAVSILLKVRGIGGRVEEQLAVLSESGFLYRQHDDVSMYAFKHALTLEVAYNTLLRSRRQDLHRDVGDAITDLLPDIATTRPEVLAHHFTEAQHPSRAIPYWLKAGQKSIQRSAHVEATAHLNKGIQLLDLLPDSPDRAETELDLRVTLGPALMAIKGPGATEVEQSYSRARELCRRVGEMHRLFPILFGLWRFYLLRADLRLSRELSEDLLTLAQQGYRSDFLLEAYFASGASLFWTGETASSQERLAWVVAAYDSTRHEAHAYVYGQNPLVICLCYKAFGLWALGCPDQAVVTIQEAVATAEELRHPFTLAYALFGAAIIHQLRDRQSVE